MAPCIEALSNLAFLIVFLGAAAVLDGRKAVASPPRHRNLRSLRKLVLGS